MIVLYLKADIPQFEYNFDGEARDENKTPIFKKRNHDIDQNHRHSVAHYFCKYRDHRHF